MEPVGDQWQRLKKLTKISGLIDHCKAGRTRGPVEGSQWRQGTQTATVEPNRRAKAESWTGRAQVKPKGSVQMPQTPKNTVDQETVVVQMEPAD